MEKKWGGNMGVGGKGACIKDRGEVSEVGFRGRRENVKLFNEGGVTKRENNGEDRR